MKYPAHIYAKALTSAVLEKGVSGEVIVKNFLALVRRNGDEVHLRKIVEEADRMMREKTGIRNFVVASARPLEESAHALIAELMKPGDRMEERVSPELIAGIKIVMNDERQLDGSLRGALDKLFGNVS